MPHSNLQIWDKGMLHVPFPRDVQRPLKGIICRPRRLRRARRNWWGSNKYLCQELAEELGLIVEASLTKPKLKDLIVKSPDYIEDDVKVMIDSIVKDRIRTEEKEEKLRREQREYEEKLRREQREYEEKLREEREYELE
ncbi:hypothetical protein TNCV_2783631 [Trichonephila clavipes]|nr:hypothetical protein TNCV_2783631 [Trichonephila clavipes]